MGKHFRWVQKAFDEANRAMLAWKGERFQHDSLPGHATRESEPTMKRFGEERYFRTRSGERVKFEHHMKWKAERIHYLVDQDRRLLIIGYVGPHLPTVSDPT